METQENTFLASQLRADQFIAGQRHSPRRIAKHLSRAGFAAAGVISVYEDFSGSLGGRKPIEDDPKIFESSSINTFKCISLFLEIPVVKTLETCTVASFILCHLVNSVVDSVVVQLFCLGSDGKFTLAGAAFSLDSLLEVCLGVPNHVTEKFSKLGSVLSFLKCISLECLSDFRISLTVSLTAHGQVHADLAAFTGEIRLQTFVNLSIATFGNTDNVLASPSLGSIFLDFYEFVSFCVANRALCRWVLALINIAANEASEFLFHILFSFFKAVARKL